MVDVSGAKGPSPSDQERYHQELNKSVSLFQESLQNYEKSKEIHQKEKYEDVMKKLMQVMQDSCNALMKEQLKKAEAKLEQDYQTWEKDHSEESRQKLMDDLDAIKRAE